MRTGAFFAPVVKMDLCSYIVGEKLVLVIAPKYTSAVNWEDAFYDYISTNEYSVGRVRSDSIHQHMDVSGYNILLYTSLIAYNKAKLVHKSTSDVVIIEWGFNYSLLQGLLRKNPDVQVLRVDLTNESNEQVIRNVSFKHLELPLSAKFSEWYKYVTSSSDFTSVAKSMVGNHFFDNATWVELAKTLTGDDHASTLEGPQPDDHFENGLKSTAPGASSMEYAYPSHPREVKDKSVARRKDSKGNKLKTYSPKLYSIARIFISKPGKYVIVTSHTKSYGARFARDVLSTIFNAKPHILDPKMEHADETIRKFNESNTSLLITSVLPSAKLKDVKGIIIMDTYSVDMITRLIQNTCNIGCGGNMFPMSVILLTLVYPNKDDTLEIREARKSLAIIDEMDNAYEGLYNQAKPIKVKGQKFYVL